MARLQNQYNNRWRGQKMMNKRQKYLLLISLLSIALVFLGCQSTTSKTVNANQEEQTQAALASKLNVKTTSEGQVAYDYLKLLEGKNPNRAAGTHFEKESAVTIQKELEKLGYAVVVQNFEFSSGSDGSYPSQNVMVTINPKKKDRIVIGAHYDSDPIGHGMDDNGSGVAVLLSLAKTLKGSQSNCRIDLVFFGAEEEGCWGSEHYAANMLANGLAKPKLMINFDSLIAGDDCNVYVGKPDDKNLADILAIAGKAKLPLVTQNEKKSHLPYGMTLDASDHAIFKEKGIPILYFEATNWALGKFDGYTQTADTRVTEGMIWHSEQDNLKFIEDTFGDRPLKNLSIFTDITLRYLRDKGILK